MLPGAEHLLLRQQLRYDQLRLLHLSHVSCSQHALPWAAVAHIALASIQDHMHCTGHLQTAWHAV